MDKVPPEFKQFVKCVINDVHYPKLTFKTAEELQFCIKFFFETATADVNISARFATQANRLHFVYPENEKYPNVTKFRQVLVKEAKQQVQEMGEMLNSASCVTAERALGTYKFFGDLFNIEFIFIGPLRKTMSILQSLSFESELALKCLKLLVQTVRENVKLRPDDYSGDYKYLIEMVNKPEYFDKSGPKPVTKLEPLNLENQFPFLNGQAKSPEIKLTAEDKLEVFASILDTLTSSNCADVIKKIEDSDKNLFENTSWQAYFDLLIAEALLQPDLADSIVNISQRLSKSKNVWTSVKKEDYQKYIYILIAKEIEASPTQSREDAIMNLFKTLINKSLCSLGNIATLMMAANQHSDTNMRASASVLCKIVEIVRWKFSEVKIQKLPEETRRKAVEILKTKEMCEAKFELIEKYLLGGDASGTHMQRSDNELEDNVHDKNSTTRGSLSSPPLPGEASNTIISFNVYDFLEEAFTHNVEASLKQFVQSSMSKSGWDSVKVAKMILQNVVVDHRKEIYNMKVAIAINKETKNDEFGKKLGKLVIDALKDGLRGAELKENCKNLITIAVFLSDLYKHGWITSQEIFGCMGLAAEGDFESFEKVKILKGLIKPSVGQLKMQCSDDRFTFYLQIIRKRMTEDKTPERQEIYSELIDLLVRITSFEDCSSFDSEDSSSTSSASFSSATTSSLPAVDHVVSIQNLMKDYMPSKWFVVSRGISAVIRDHPGEIEKLVSCVIDRALEHINESETFVALMTSLSETLADFDNFLTFEDCIRMYFQKVFDGVADGVFPNDDISHVYKAMVFHYELFKDQPIDNRIVVGVIEHLMKNERTCVKSVQCIVHLMRTIGEKVEKENRKAIDRYFLYFEHVIRDSNQDDFRTYEYKKLIEYRANGWRNAENYALNGWNGVKTRDVGVLGNEKEWKLNIDRTLVDFLEEGDRWKPPDVDQRISPKLTLVDPISIPVTKLQNFENGKLQKIENGNLRSSENGNLNKLSEAKLQRSDEVKLRSSENGKLPRIDEAKLQKLNEANESKGEIVITLDNLEDNEHLTRLATILCGQLKSEKHLQTFFEAILNRKNADRSEISLYVQLFGKLAEIFESLDDAPVEFVEQLIDVINTEFAETSGWRNFDTEMRLKFRRLMIICGELYTISVLSDEDFAPWLYHKHIQQLSLEELVDLSDAISPKIEEKGNKRIRLALNMLEKTIREMRAEMSTLLMLDIKELNGKVAEMAETIARISSPANSPSL